MCQGLPVAPVSVVPEQNSPFSHFFRRKRAAFPIFCQPFCVVWESGVPSARLQESFPITLFVHIHRLSNMTGRKRNYLLHDFQALYWNIIWDAEETVFLVIYHSWVDERSTEKTRTTKEHRIYMERLLIANSIFHWVNATEKEKNLYLRVNIFSCICCVSDDHHSPGCKGLCGRDVHNYLFQK